MLNKCLAALALLMLACAGRPTVSAAAEAAGAAAGQAETCSATLQGGLVVLQNANLRVAIDPQLGGRIVQYVYKPLGDTNLAFPAQDNGGMTMDMFWQQAWPGELLKNPYQYEIVNPGPREAAVRVWRLSTGETNGKLIEDVAGIRVQRTISLRAGERALHVQVDLKNTAERGRLAGYWMQNNFFLKGRKEANTWYRPSIYGVDRTSIEKPSAYYWYFVEAPTAGWIGVANTQLNGGLMLLMDYNDLWKLYTNLGAVTTEWFYDRVAIPPGKSWQTEVAIVPTPGMGSYAFGSEPLIASLDIAPAAGVVTVTHKLTAGTIGLHDIVLHTSAVSATGAWKSASVAQPVAALTNAVTTLTTTITDAGPPPLAVNVEVEGTTDDGKKVTLHYGDYFGGASGKNTDLVTLKPQYAFTAPAKRKVFLKPDTIVKAKNDHLRVLFVRGLWHKYAGVDEALQGIAGAEVVDSWYTESDTGSSLLNFPSDYATLMGFDVVVLANIDGGSLGLVGQEMLADFVQAGGGLLFVGGDRTFGQAGFQNPRFLQLMPVALQGTFDWHREKAATPLVATADALMAGVHFEPGSIEMYRHFLKPVAAATVQVTAGGAPALVTLPLGEGRVAASLLLPFGEPAAGQKGYWQSAPWFGALRNTLLWLNHQNH